MSANRELVERMEQRIQDAIARVWTEPTVPESMWVPFDFPSLATRPMANGGGCPRYGELLSESLVASLPWAWKRAYSGVRFTKAEAVGMLS